MRNSRRPRVLTVRGQQFRWRTYHRHVDGCEEVLWIRQRGAPAGLTLVFRPGAERRIPDGGVSTAGVVGTRDLWLNLNEPGVVRAFLDAAVRRGFPAVARTAGPCDGWELFDEVHAHVTASRRYAERPGPE